jgi:hypothetical protein
MPRLEYFLVAEATSIDRETNNISIFNVLNDVRFESLPVIIPKGVAISCWIASEQEIAEKSQLQAVLRIHAPGDEPRVYRGNFTCDVRVQHILFEIVGMKIGAAGELRFDLDLNERNVASHTVFLRPRAE